MSKYTTQLRWVMEQTMDNQGLPHSEESWPKCYAFIGLSDYPIFQESYRQQLNDKIIRHYYFREIGAETVARFRWNMREAMRLIMPYYNKLLESTVIDVSHLLGENYDETIKMLEGVQGTGSSTGSSQATGTSDNDVLNRLLDTPQARVENLDDGWLTQVSKTHTDDSSESSASSKSDSTSTKDTNRIQTREFARYDPTLYKNLLTYGERLLNIDRMIVEHDEIAQCFMQVW